MTRQRPTGIVLVAIWFFLGGLGAIGYGAVSAISFGTVAGFYADLFALFGAATGAYRTVQTLSIIIGILLAGAGIALMLMGYWLLQGDERGRKGGIITSAAGGVAWLLLGVLPILILGGVFAGSLLWFVAIGILFALPVLYLMGAEAKAYCGEGIGYGYTYAPPSPLPPTVVGSPLPPTTAVPPPPTPAPRSPAPPPLDRTRVVGGQPAPAGWLVVRSGQRAGKQLGLSQIARNTIGRDGTRCDLVLDDGAVSGEHACLQWENGQFVLYDMASRNGTFVNGRRIQRQSLMDDDVIRLGDSTLVFKSVK